MPDDTKPDLTPYLARAGITLTPEAIAEYLPAYQYVQAMIARVGSERSYMVEPAHVFAFPEGTVGEAKIGGAK